MALLGLFTVTDAMQVPHETAGHGESCTLEEANSLAHHEGDDLVEPSMFPALPRPEARQVSLSAGQNPGASVPRPPHTGLSDWTAPHRLVSTVVFLT